MTSFSKLLLPVLAVAVLASCDKKADATKEFQTSPTGLQYKHFPAEVKGDSARKAKPGEIMSLHMAYDNGADSILFSTWEKNQPIQVPHMPASYKGGIEEGFQM